MLNTLTLMMTQRARLRAVMLLLLVVSRLTGATWTYEQKLVAGDGAAFDGAGNALAALDDDTLLVGASGATHVFSDCGVVYVWSRVDGLWVESQKLVPADPSAAKEFGASIAVTGTAASATIVIGAPGDTGGDGALYVFTGAVGGLAQVDKLSSPAAGAELGRAVAIEPASLTIVGGAPEDTTNGFGAGGAQVWSVTGPSAWGFDFHLHAGDGGALDSLGSAVGVDASYAYVGAPGRAADGGKLYRFVLSTGADAGGYTSAESTPGNSYGDEVVVCGSAGFLIVSDSTNAGSLHVLSAADPSVRLALLSVPGASPGEFLGVGAAAGCASGAIVGGTPGNDDGAPDSGGAAAWAPVDAANPPSGWSFVNKLANADPTLSVGAGSSVAVYDVTAAFGSVSDGDAGASAGAVYVYVRPASPSPSPSPSASPSTSPSGSGSASVSVSVSVSPVASASPSAPARTDASPSASASASQAAQSESSEISSSSISSSSEIDSVSDSSSSSSSSSASPAASAPVSASREPSSSSCSSAHTRSSPPTVQTLTDATASTASFSLGSRSEDLVLTDRSGRELGRVSASGPDVCGTLSVRAARSESALALASDERVSAVVSLRSGCADGSVAAGRSVRLCLWADVPQAHVADHVLAYYNVERAEWLVVDDSLDGQDTRERDFESRQRVETLVCGTTRHFTDFGVLLGSAAGRPGGDGDGGDSSNYALRTDPIFIVSVSCAGGAVLLVCAVCITYHVVRRRKRMAARVNVRAKLKESRPGETA